MRLALTVGLFLLVLATVAPAADLPGPLKHLSALDEPTAIAQLADGRVSIATLSPTAALTARAAGVPVHAVYLVGHGADQRYLVVRDEFAKSNAAELDQLLRALDAERGGARPAVPGPAQTAQLRVLAVELAKASTARDVSALDAAAATLVDRSSAKRALAQVSVHDPRCGAFCDHW